MCSHQQLKNTWNIAEEVNILQQRCFLQPITHEKKKKRKKMKKNNTSCSFILTLKRNKIPEITSLIWCAQKPIKTIHNLPSKVKIATTIYILGSHHSQSRRWKGDRSGAQLKRLWRVLHARRTLQATRHQSHANRQWSQDTQFRLAPYKIHRLHELFSHGFVELSKNIWNSRTKERVFSPFLQHAAKSKLCWVHAWQILLRPRRNVHSAQRWIPQVVWRKSIWKIHFQFPTWTLNLLSIRCKTPQTRVHDLSIPIQRYCRLQPYGTLYHYHFCLQCGIQQKMDAWKQNRRTTGTWMAFPSHPILCCPNMALLGRKKTDQNQSPAPKQRWKNTDAWISKICRRWIRRINTYRLWISRVFLPWVSQVFSKSHHETSHSPK